jgi:hypothetical protein
MSKALFYTKEAVWAVTGDRRGRRTLSIKIWDTAQKPTVQNFRGQVGDGRARPGLAATVFQSMPMCPPHEARLLSSSPRINYRIRHLERERWALPRAGSWSKTAADEWGAACSELVRGYGQPPREATGAAGTSLVLAWVMLYGIFVRIHVCRVFGSDPGPGNKVRLSHVAKKQGRLRGAGLVALHSGVCLKMVETRLRSIMASRAGSILPLGTASRRKRLDMGGLFEETLGKEIRKPHRSGMESKRP